jgi:SAM-dependent methyltransferase
MFNRSARLYDAIYSFKDYPAEAARVHDLVEARAPAARTLLDVACGTGTHLAELRRWYEVEGVDLDPGLLELARERLPGVPLHEGDMTELDLGRGFDVVTCLFSSIGYVRTRDGLNRATAALARHVAPGGVLVIEPWFEPGGWEAGRLDAQFVDEPDLKVVRMNTTEPAGDTTAFELHYLVGTPDGIESFTERHELGVFSREEHVEALRAEGLSVEYDPEGLMGRGLYIATRGA